MEKVFAYLPLLFGQNNTERDDERRLFSVITRTIKENIVNNFISCDLIICYYNNGIVERSKKIYKSYFIDGLILKGKKLYREAVSYQSCMLYDIEMGSIFSSKKIFLGQAINSHFITSVEHLGNILENEWKKYSDNILVKYKLLKCVMDKDVALRIMQMVCLLGVY